MCQLCSSDCGRKTTQGTKRSAARLKSASGPLPVRMLRRMWSTSRARTSYSTAVKKTRRVIPPRVPLRHHLSHPWLLPSKLNSTKTFLSATLKMGNPADLPSCQLFPGMPHLIYPRLSSWIYPNPSPVCTTRRQETWAWLSYKNRQKEYLMTWLSLKNRYRTYSFLFLN